MQCRRYLVTAILLDSVIAPFLPRLAVATTRSSPVAVSYRDDIDGKRFASLSTTSARTRTLGLSSIGAASRYSSSAHRPDGALRHVAAMATNWRNRLHHRAEGFGRCPRRVGCAGGDDRINA